MTETAKIFFIFTASTLLVGCTLGSRAEVELVSVLDGFQNDQIHNNQHNFSHPYSAFSNLTVYLSFLDDIYNYLSSSSNVSGNCRLEANKLLDKVNDGDINALKILDSTGKPSSGVLEGGIFFIGFYSECITTVVNLNSSQNIKGQYCLVNLNFSDATRHENIPQASWLVLNQSQKPPSIGICIPSSCSKEDLSLATSSSLEYNFESVQSNISVCYGDSSEFSKDIGALCILFLLVIFLFIVIAATVADVIQDNSKCMTELNENAGDNAKSLSREVLCEIPEPKPPKKSFPLECLLAFSLKRNIKKLFFVEKESEIGSVHGLKFFSMALIILGHTFSFGTVNLFFRNPAAAVSAPKDFLSQIFANGTLAVDTFYFISGLLVSLVTLKFLRKTDGKFPLFYFYFHRYFRLTPLMIMVILICAYLLRYLGSGPIWLSSIMMYDDWCKTNGWINALYLHNFIHTENMCLSHTWYLATDMQFYLIVPLILIPLYKNWKFGMFVSVLFLFATTLTTALITVINHYPAIPYINNILPQNLVDEYYKNVYIKPYCRMGPYIIGILVGYLFYRKKELVLRKLHVIIIWMTSVALGLLIIYLMWPANQGFLPTDSEAAAYSSLARTLWSVTIGWLVIACYYGYGGFVNKILSWTPLVPLSRLTYCAYLIHPVVMNVHYGSTQTVVDFSLSFMIYLFIGNICITFFLSIFLCAIFESPFIALEKAILSRRSS